MTETYDIQSRHTDEMVADETRFCIGDFLPMVTLGGFLRLCLMKSPYVFGGDVTLDDVNAACRALGSRDNANFDADLRMEMDAIWRAFEIIVPSQHAAVTSQIPEYGPEWMADIMAAAADAVPSLTVRDMLDRLPMITLIHLVAAAHRKNGGTTRRPDDQAAVAEILRSLNQ